MTDEHPEKCQTISSHCLQQVERILHFILESWERMMTSYILITNQPILSQYSKEKDVDRLGGNFTPCYCSRIYCTHLSIKIMRNLEWAVIN